MWMNAGMDECRDVVTALGATNQQTCFAAYPKLSSDHGRTKGWFTPAVNETLEVFHNRTGSFSLVPHFLAF